MQLKKIYICICKAGVTSTYLYLRWSICDKLRGGCAEPDVGYIPAWATRRYLLLSCVTSSVNKSITFLDKISILLCGFGRVIMSEGPCCAHTHTHTHTHTKHTHTHIHRCRWPVSGFDRWTKTCRICLLRSDLVVTHRIWFSVVKMSFAVGTPEYWWVVSVYRERLCERGLQLQLIDKTSTKTLFRHGEESHLATPDIARQLPSCPLWIITVKKYVICMWFLNGTIVEPSCNTQINTHT